MKRVLFISHEASRTGAPSSLLRALRFLRDTGDIEPEILIMHGGPLEDEFRKMGNVAVLWNPDPGPSRAATGIGRDFSRFLYKIGKIPGHIRLHLMMRRYRRMPPDAVYMNTIVTARLIAPVAALGCPVIMHIHELAYAMQLSLRPGIAALLRKHIARFIVPSQPVADHWTGAYGFPASQIIVIPECVPDPLSASVVPDGVSFRTARGIPADAIVIGMTGTAEWRKGVDLFIRIARILVARDPRLFFIWVGGGPLMNTSESAWKELYGVDDVLARRLLFTGETARAQEAIASMDIFMLTSREDPAPLVLTEAGFQGKPFLCFSASGGAPLLAQEGGGIVVPYGDTDVMAEEVLLLAGDPDRRRRMGEQARKTMLRLGDAADTAREIHGVIRGIMS